MEEKKLVPKRRFKGFEDKWSSSKLGETLEVTMGHSPKSSSYTNNPSDYILVQGNADLKKDRVIPRVWTNQVTKTANKNDLIMTVRAPVGEIGKTEYDVVLGRGVAGLKGNEFIFQHLIKMKMEGYWTKLSTGSTFDSVDSNDIKEVALTLPSEKEQQKIGEFFKVLDERIANQERKVAKVKALKAAYLTELFPQEGETVPKRRFKGFEGEWIKKEIGEVFRITRGNVLSTTKIKKKRSKIACYPVYSSQTRNNGLLGYYSDFLYDTAITWTTDGANAGTVKYREGKFYSTNVNGVLVSNDGYACKAVAELLNLEAWKHVSKVGNPKLMSNVMARIEILIPKDTQELEKLSLFFKNIDDQIEMEEKKLDKLQKMKEAYLEEMFV